MKSHEKKGPSFNLLAGLEPNSIQVPCLACKNMYIAYLDVAVTLMCLPLLLHHCLSISFFFLDKWSVFCSVMSLKRVSCRFLGMK